MQPFSISRLNTEFGIVKASGQWLPHQRIIEKLPIEQLTIERLAMMATDGWVELDCQHPSNQALLDKLLPLMLAHLSSQHQQ